MYVRSLTSNAVSLHSAGVLRLHNQNLNMGEKTGRSRRTRLLIIIFIPALYQPLMILTVQKITQAADFKFTVLQLLLKVDVYLI